MHLLMRFLIFLLLNAILLPLGMWLTSQFVRNVQFSNIRAVLAQGAGMILVISLVQALVPFGLLIVFLIWLAGFYYAFGYQLRESLILALVVCVLAMLLGPVIHTGALVSPFAW